MKRIIEILAVGVDTDSDTPVANGFVTVYDAGTSTLRTVYSDFALLTPLANPATLDADGKLIAYTDKRVKLFIQTSALATVRTIDNVGTADSDLAGATASDLAGSGLIAPGDGTMAVNVDGSTVEISSDILRVKDAGIVAAKLGANAVTEAKANFVMGANELDNCIVSCSVASSALTISLKTKAAADASATDPITIGFRSATLTSGAYSYGSVTAALSTVISSGSTAGHTSASEWPLYVYALLTGSTVELAWSTSPVDERYLQTTTVEGAAGAADSLATLYSTTARTNVAVRLIGVLKSTQTTAGTWAVVPTHISSPTAPHPLSQLVMRINGTSPVPVGGVALSASSGNFFTAANADTVVTNLSVTITTSGRPVMVMLVADGVNITSYVSAAVSMTGNANLDFYRGATSLGGNSTAAGMTIPCSAYKAVDAVAAGTYTYTVKVRSDGTRNYFVNYAKLLAYEI